MNLKMDMLSNIMIVTIICMNKLSNLYILKLGPQNISFFRYSLAQKII